MTYRVGLVVPSSNTTMETEIPALLHARSAKTGESFTFHSSRMRMKQVTPEELARMDAESTQCAVELTDAHCDVIAYACLVAVMAQGSGAHVRCEGRLGDAASGEGRDTPIVSSAGALVTTVRELGLQRVALIAPYMRPLTAMVVDYLQDEGIEVTASVSLEIADNVEVGRISSEVLWDAYQRLDREGADAVILSACVQMPSLALVERVEADAGVPVITAATSTVRQILRRLDLSLDAPGGGSILVDASRSG